MQRKEAKRLERQVPTKGRSFWSDGAESNDALRLCKNHREDTVGLRATRTIRRSIMQDPIIEEPVFEKEWKNIRGASSNATPLKYSTQERSSSEPALNWETVGLRVARGASRQARDRDA